MDKQIDPARTIRVKGVTKDDDNDEIVEILSRGGKLTNTIWLKVQGEEILFVEHEHAYEAEGALMFQGFDLENGHSLDINLCTPDDYTLILSHLKEVKEAKEDENDSFVVIGEPEEKPLPEVSKPVETPAPQQTPAPVELKDTPTTLVESVMVEQPVEQDPKKEATLPEGHKQALESMQALVQAQKQAQEHLELQAKQEADELREKRDAQRKIEAEVRAAELRIEEERQQKLAEELRKAQEAKKAQELLRLEEERKRNAAEAEKQRLELEKAHQEELKRQAEEARRKEVAAKEAAKAETQADVKPRERQEGSTASKVKTEAADSAKAPVDAPRTLSNIDWNQLLEQAKDWARPRDLQDALQKGLQVILVYMFIKGLLHVFN